MVEKSCCTVKGPGGPDSEEDNLSCRFKDYYIAPEVLQNLKVFIDHRAPDPAAEPDGIIRSFSEHRSRSLTINLTTLSVGVVTP